MSLAQHLDDLERRSLIALGRATPDLAYIFRHVMAQDAVYASLLRRQRGAIHELVGDVLENLYAQPAASPQLAALLGRHFSEAGDGARALPYLVQAGDDALGQYANREAADYYTRALVIARAQPAAAGLAHLYEARGLALERSGDYAGALAGYEAMETWAAGAGDEAQTLAALTAQTRLRSTFTTVADPIQGRALAERAVVLAQRLGNGAAEVRLLLYTMRLAVWADDERQTTELGERAAALARARGLNALLVEALNELAFWGYINSMQFRLAGERLEEAGALLPALAAPYQSAETLSNLIVLNFMRGEFELALRYTEELHDISQAVDYGWGLAGHLLSTGIGRLERGEVGAALPLLEDGIRRGSQYSVGHAAVMTCGFLARAYGAVGEFEAGLAAVRRVAMDTAGGPRLALWPLAAETLLQLGAGNVPDAAAALEQVRLDPPTDIISYRLLVNAQAELDLAQGDPERVLRDADPVIDAMRREGGRTILCEALAFRGRALLAAGRLEEAGPSLAEARSLAEAIGMRPALWTILAAQLELAARQGQTAAADALRERLRTLLHQLADAAGSPQRRAGFLAVPAVRAALQL